MISTLQGRSRTTTFLVDRKIEAFGTTVTVGQATAEEIEQYLYDTLDKIYLDKEAMVETRDRLCSHDLSDLNSRIYVMNTLHEINRKRQAGPVALFADET